MTDENEPATLAVLIDAENVSASVADGLFEEIAKYGYACVRRAYGDFGSAQTAAWAEKCGCHAIEPRHSGTHGRGKNAADISLVIDAMDLLHSGSFDGFCLVSTDSDFVSLAIRIREQGLNVFGFGNAKTPERFRHACHRFTFVENLLPHAPANKANSTMRPLQHPSTAMPALKKAIARIDQQDRWTDICVIENELALITTDFDPRTYGCRTLTDLLLKLNNVVVDLVSTGKPRMRFKGAQRQAKGRKVIVPSQP